MPGFPSLGGIGAVLQGRNVPLTATPHSPRDPGNGHHGANVNDRRHGPGPG